MKKSVLFEKRKKARELKKKGWSNLRIARHLMANKDSIKKWLEMDEEDLKTDRRGCRPKSRCKYGDLELQRILEIRSQLVYEPGARKGSSHIKERYRQLYGEEISEWFINKSIRQHRERIVEGKKHRPTVSTFRLPSRLRKDKVIMSLEFLGVRHLKVPGESVFFLACKYLEPFKLGVVSKVSAMSCDEVVKVLKYTWTQYRMPDFVQMPYHSVFGANLVHERCIGNLALFLLNVGVVPVYVPVERDAENVDLFNGEGIFSHEFCDCLAMGSDRGSGLKIDSFYLEYRDSKGNSGQEIKLSKPAIERLKGEDFLKNRVVKNFPYPYLYFVQIASRPEGGIRILSYDIRLDRQYGGHPIFCKLDLKKKTSYLFQSQ